MRDPIENISKLQGQLNELQMENQFLKNLLDQKGIPFRQALNEIYQNNTPESFDPNQGGRIISPNRITDEMANSFFARFWGRQDVYAKRNVNKTTGKVGYFTQCENFWKQNCHKRLRDKITCRKCEYYTYKALTKADILAHLRGESQNACDVIGIYPLFENNTCRFLVFDFDNHENNAEQNDYANVDDKWIEEVNAMRQICAMNGIDPLVERSRSGRGVHIWIFFEKPISATLARKFGAALLDKGAESVNLKSFRYYDRMLPAQDQLPQGGLGNVIALPLQGQALKNGNSAFIDANWNAYPNQWEILLNKPRLSQEFLELKIKEWAVEYPEGSYFDSDGKREKPWKKCLNFEQDEVSGQMIITQSNGIYIDSTNLKISLQNKIRKMALISNPIYYKNLAIKTSNYNTPSRIYLGKDHLGGYIEIPRGLYEELLENTKRAEIEYCIQDERQAGRKIKVDFNGELRKEQTEALTELSKHDNGILHAATAFGKTVVCAAMIAEKKVNTLIILESSALIEQWYEALEKFLLIEEDLPTYQTKSGRIKTRKNIIGKLQGAHDSMTGVVDIAMAGSLCKKGEYHERLNQYGMVIVDECHHAAADTLSKVLQEVKAKYVYGVTATPKRTDGLEKIIYMLIGPIRYSFTAKDKAQRQGVDHYVYPRFTRTVPARGISITDRMHPNDAYKILQESKTRDEQLLRDIRECVLQGRSPVVLSRYKDHSEKLYALLKNDADHVFLMTGNNSKREHKNILEQMRAVGKEESMILIATGSLIGEGFDYPRLDTLFMAMPVATRTIVEQYAGRLNRDYEGKKNVIIYDYVDSHIPMFDNMYAKRLKAYKQIGYEVCSGIKGEKQTANAIFDGDSYASVFKRDLLEARKNILISSPVISGIKVRELIFLLKEKQESGVEITIVTWTPDSYTFGDSAFWMQLHEEMRQAGVYVKTVENSCEHFAIIDHSLVWYGNINILGKTKEEDSMMRLESEKIAGELMELTLG